MDLEGGSRDFHASDHAETLLRSFSTDGNFWGMSYRMQRDAIPIPPS
jgi:hypothetical protein